MKSKTTELFDAFDVADLSFFILLAKKKYKIYIIRIRVNSHDSLFYLTKYRKKIFK